MEKKAVVLLSGGLDSSTCLGVALNMGYICYCLSFDYGQRHSRELEHAKAVYSFFSEKYPHLTAEHKVIKIDLRTFGGSALTDDIPVPDYKENSQGHVPVTYVPARNLILLSYAVAFAEVRGCGAVYIGVNAIDYSGYPDCRPQFIKAFEEAANLATGNGFTKHLKVETPLQNLSKAEIVKLAVKIGVPVEKTWSCYRGGEKPCGRCDSCVLRLKGFREAGIEDPLQYAL
ncbi:MAG: 7-cyano-7-deazaguanine synthase QueC [Thermoplasmata archaeon]